MSKEPYLYYCWMRVLPANGESTVGQEPLKSMSVPLEVMAGPRPPRVTSASGTKLAGHIEYWYADEEYHGDPTAQTVIDYGPAHADRGAAIGWLASADGKRWVAEADNHFLFTFELKPADAQPQEEQ
jgi:hypothetical protein